MLSADDLFEMYKIFADVHGLDMDREDETFLRGDGYKKLRLTGYVEYKPLNGVRFSVTETGERVECSGYGIGTGPGLRSKVLKERVAKYLAERK